MTEIEDEGGPGRQDDCNLRGDPTIRQAARRGLVLLLGLCLGLVVLGLLVGLNSDILSSVRVLFPVICIALFLWAAAVAVKVVRRMNSAG